MNKDERLDALFDELQPIFNKMDFIETMSFVCLLVWKLYKASPMSREGVMEAINYALDQQEKMENTDDKQITIKFTEK